MLSEDLPLPDLEIAPATSCCWGAQLQCTSTRCWPVFRIGKRHFKTKFCAACRQEVVVPASRVRALAGAPLHRQFANKHSGGVWTRMSEQLGGGGYRVINNTGGCVSPVLVVFDSAPPPQLAWQPLPREWVSDKGNVSLLVSRGTLVPVASVQRERVPANHATAPLEMSPLPIVIPEPEVKPEPEPEPVCDHPALAPLEEIGELDSDESEPSPTPTVVDKKMQRMLRNRKSAATSRERKRKYVEALEAQVDELTHVVQKLREENSLLQLFDFRGEGSATV